MAKTKITKIEEVVGEEEPPPLTGFSKEVQKVDSHGDNRCHYPVFDYTIEYTRRQLMDSRFLTIAGLYGLVDES